MSRLGTERGVACHSAPSLTIGVILPDALLLFTHVCLHSRGKRRSLDQLATPRPPRQPSLETPRKLITVGGAKIFPEAAEVRAEEATGSRFVSILWLSVGARGSCVCVFRIIAADCGCRL